jgi:hypothetical protein
MDLYEFKEEIRLRLGEGECGVKVELDSKQIEKALTLAKRWFNGAVGLYKESILSLVLEQSEYDVSAVTPRVDKVVAMFFPQSGYGIDYSTLYPGFLDVKGIPYGDPSLFGGPYPQTTITQNMMFFESMGRTLSVDLDFEFYREDVDANNPVRIIRVMPAPKVTGTCVYLYRIDPRDIKLHMYTARDLELITDWSMAEAKYMLGRIRGKFPSGVPFAGGERQLDGDSLIQEAREDKERLRQEIKEHDGPTLPVLG